MKVVMKQAFMKQVVMKPERTAGVFGMLPSASKKMCLPVSRQRGAALVVGMIMLLLLTLIGDRKSVV